MFDKELFFKAKDIKENYPMLYKYSYEELHNHEYSLACDERDILLSFYNNSDLLLGSDILYFISYDETIQSRIKVYVKDLYELFDIIDFSNPEYTEEELFYLKLKEFI